MIPSGPGLLVAVAARWLDKHFLAAAERCQHSTMYQGVHARVGIAGLWLGDRCAGAR